MFDDPNRNLGPSDPYASRYSEMSDGAGYGPLIALGAIALIVGGLFFFAPSGDQKVATNSPAAERTAPPPAAPVTPAPPVAPKQ